MQAQLSPLVLAALVALLPSAAAAQARVVADLDYIADAEYPNKKDRLDLYVPAAAKSAPVMISVHGGLLRQGDKSEEVHAGQRFAAAGYVTAVVNYRLSPGVMHPAHVEDVAAAVAWVKKNVAAHGGDPNRIVLTGHSAGAYLIALLALDPRYLGKHGLTPRDVRGVIPVSSFFYVDRPGVAPDRPKDVWGTDPTAWKQATVPTIGAAAAPPLFLLYADGDEPWRRQQHQDFAAGLRAAGVRSLEMKMMDGRSHMSIWLKLGESGDPTADAIVRFADELVKPASR